MPLCPTPLTVTFVKTARHALIPVRRASRSRVQFYQPLNSSRYPYVHVIEKHEDYRVQLVAVSEKNGTQLELHGLTTSKAIARIHRRIFHDRPKKRYLVLIVGKGLHSRHSMWEKVKSGIWVVKVKPVLKKKVYRYLERNCAEGSFWVQKENSGRITVDLNHDSVVIS